MANKYLFSLNTGASYELDGETPDSSTDTSLNKPCRLVLDDESVFHVYDYSVGNEMKGRT